MVRGWWPAVVLVAVLGAAFGQGLAAPRTLASAISPAVAGMLLASSFAGWPLVICGALKIGYDFALLYSFRHIKPPEEIDQRVVPRKAGS